MTAYVVHHERDEAATPVACLEVVEGRITKATRPDGKDGLPSSIGMGPVVWTSRGIPLSVYQRYNRGLVLVEKGDAPKKQRGEVKKSVYRLVTEQSQLEAGFILVDDETQAIEGYAGENPPVGYQMGQTVQQWAEENRGYKIEAVPAAR